MLRDDESWLIKSLHRTHYIEVTTPTKINSSRGVLTDSAGDCVCVLGRVSSGFSLEKRPVRPFPAHRQPARNASRHGMFAILRDESTDRALDSKAGRRREDEARHHNCRPPSHERRAKSGQRNRFAAPPAPVRHIRAPLTPREPFQQPFANSEIRWSFCFAPAKYLREIHSIYLNQLQPSLIC